ncbi:MAG TPA: PilT/PilU family type 4a pilus ATPase [Pirellulaceae bacterium]|jgi:twitching motility protein PilT|nr:PilT/PilU family type 4a pilus ATPase [Pirellulaceae bacterium]
MKDAAQKKLRDILDLCIEMEASDVHITSGVTPFMRLQGAMKPVTEEELSPFVVEQMAMGLMSDHQREVFNEVHTLDFAFFSESGTRFRLNVFRQRGTIAMAIRRLDDEFRSVDDLTLPPQVLKIADFKHGLVLVTGPTGSGKSTTLATIIDKINETHAKHIITIEDPLEFIHANKMSLIRQRELHSDVPSFHEAVRASLREDPDVLLVGELRDLPTMRAALTAAETGHLVFSTLHTNDVVGTVSRMIGAFSAEEQDAVRNQLSRVLRAVVSQRLLKRVEGTGRVPAVEIMFVTSAIGNLVRKGELEQIYSLMQTGNSEGMLLLEQSLASLYAFGLISKEEALSITRDLSIFESRVQHIQETRGKMQPA